MRDYGATTYFLVKLFNQIDGNEVLFTSSRLSCLHDANELIHLLAFQIQGKIPYQISEVTSINGITYSIDYPRCVQKHIYCKHYPFKPLFLDVKRKRRSEREKPVCFMNFKHCVPPSSRLQLDTLLLSVLDELEESTGLDLRVNSAFRPVSYEVSKGRTGSSAHCLGKAVDIYCYSDGMRFQIVKTALQLGINRIGIYKTFVHLDVATNKDGKTGQVIWYG